MWLSVTSSKTVPHAAAALSRWQWTFTAPIYIISYQSAHFMSCMLAAIAQEVNVQHKLIVAYSQWVNVAVETLSHDICAPLRAMLE